MMTPKTKSSSKSHYIKNFIVNNKIISAKIVPKKTTKKSLQLSLNESYVN